MLIGSSNIGTAVMGRVYKEIIPEPAGEDVTIF
jgi:hypothetical protein